MTMEPVGYLSAQFFNRALVPLIVLQRRARLPRSPVAYSSSSVSAPSMSKSTPGVLALPPKHELFSKYHNYRYDTLLSETL